MFANKAMRFKSEFPILYLNSFEDIGVEVNDFLKFVGGLWSLTFFRALKL